MTIDLNLGNYKAARFCTVRLIYVYNKYFYIKEDKYNLCLINSMPKRSQSIRELKRLCPLWLKDFGGLKCSKMQSGLWVSSRFTNILRYQQMLLRVSLNY